MLDAELYWQLHLSLDPADNARARWLLFLREEQDRVLASYIAENKAEAEKRKKAR